MKSTIGDVARLSEVSITTVSRVINNNYPVKKDDSGKIVIIALAPKEGVSEAANSAPRSFRRSLLGFRLARFAWRSFPLRFISFERSRV